MRALALLLLLAFHAGCMNAGELTAAPPAIAQVGTTAPSVEECAALAARAPSRNAPPLAFFASGPSDVAMSLAAALGDPLLSREPRAPTGGFTGNTFPDVTQEWETERGYIELVEDGRGKPHAWRYWAQGFWAPLDAAAAREAFTQVLTRLGMPVDTLADPGVRLTDDQHQRRVDGAAAQTRTGRGLALSGHSSGSPGADFWIVRDAEMGERSQFTLRVMHDLREASIGIPTQEVARLATLAARCHLREQPYALETFQGAPTPADEPFIEGESIAYATAVSYSETPEPCYGMRMLRVSIDAITGAPLVVGPPNVGCVT